MLAQPTLAAAVSPIDCCQANLLRAQHLGGRREARGRPGITSLREIYTVGLPAPLLNMPVTLRDVKEDGNVSDAPRL